MAITQKVYFFVVFCFLSQLSHLYIRPGWVGEFDVLELHCAVKPLGDHSLF